jgi:hypothetical protein
MYIMYSCIRERFSVYRVEHWAQKSGHIYLPLCTHYKRQRLVLCCGQLQLLEGPQMTLLNSQSLMTRSPLLSRRPVKHERKSTKNSTENVRPHGIKTVMRMGSFPVACSVGAKSENKRPRRKRQFENNEETAGWKSLFKKVLHWHCCSTGTIKFKTLK